MAYLLVNRAYQISKLRSESLGEAFQEAINERRIENFIPVVPTSRQARHLRRRLIREAYSQTNRPVELAAAYNLEQLALRVFNLSNLAGTKRIISDAYRLALFEEAAESTNLVFFRRRQEQLSPVSLQRLASVVFGLKEDGITPENLLEDIARVKKSEKNGAMPGGEEIDIAKLGDLAALYTEYNRLLGDSLIDKPAMTRLAAEAVAIAKSKSSDDCFPKDAVIFMEGFTEFKQPEVEFIKELCGLATPIALRLDYSDNNGPLFGNLASALDYFTSSGLYIRNLDGAPKVNCDASIQERVFSPLGAYLRRWLFNTERQILHAGFSEFTTIIATDDRNDEITTIAKLARHLIVEKNYAASDICIAARQIDIYADLIREIFSAHDIPVNVTDRYPLAKSPVTVAVFSALDVIINGFRREDAHRALQNPFLNFTNSKTGLQIDGVNLYSIASRLRIFGGARFGGRQQWIRSLEREIKRVESRLVRLRSDEFSDLLDIEQAERELNAVKRANDDFAAICETLPDAHVLAPPSELASLIKREIIDKFQLRQSIVEFYKQIATEEFSSKTEKIETLADAEKDARALKALLELLDEIAGIQEQRFGRKKLSLRQFYEKLKIATIAAKYQVREKAGYGITITTLEQTRGIPFRIIICCGMNDGEFPVAYIPDAFLGKELPDSEDRFIRAERMQFYQTLTSVFERNDNPNRHIFLTYCTRIGEELSVRSPFIDALLKITTLNDDRRIVNTRETRIKLLADEKSELLDEFSWLLAITSTSEMIKIENISNVKRSDYSPYFVDIIEYSENYLKAVENSKERFMAELPSKFRDKVASYSQRPFSVSELETYSACPYQYFSNRFLRLNERKEFGTTFSAIERGTTLHLIMYRFYRRIQKEMLEAGEIREIAAKKNEKIQPIAPVRLRKDRKQYYLQVLHEIARKEIEEITFEHPFLEMEMQTLFGDVNIKGELEKRLDAEFAAASLDMKFYPSLFEFGFGISSAGGALAGALDIGGLLLRGKIDRLEIAGGATTPKFIAADYKSGNTKSNSDIKCGLSLQMPLYILAAGKILEELYGLAALPLAAVYYRLRPFYDLKSNKVISENFVLLPKDSDIAKERKLERSTKQTVENESIRDQIVENSLKRAIDNVASVANGVFPVQPYNKAIVCISCSYAQVCRIKEL